MLTLSTRDVDGTQAHGYWSRALDAIIPGLRFEPMDAKFEASLQQRSFAGLRLSHVRAMPQRIRVSARPRNAERGQFAFIYVKSGLLRARQFGRAIEVRSGEGVMLDAAEISEVTTCRETCSLNLTTSASWVRQWLVRPEAEVAKTFVRDDKQARLLLDFLELLGDDEPRLPNSAELVSSLFGGALATAVGAGEVAGTCHAGRLLNRIRQNMSTHYFEASYCPQAAADDAGISRRYLTSLFAQAGTTFNTELMRIRLEKSAEMLREPRFLSLSVMEISLRCGFSDASHFSKRFRAQFGNSPALYRQVAGEAEDDRMHELIN